MKPVPHFRPNMIGFGLLAASLAFAGSLQAAVTFTVSDVGPALNSASPPTISLAGASVSSGTIPAAPGPVTYTLTNVDLTSIGGTATEQIVFAVSFTVGSGSVAFNATNGNVFNGAGSLANQIEAGEDLTTTLSLTSTTFAGGLSNLSLGFTSTTVGGAGTGESWNIVHDGGTQAGSTALGITRSLPLSSFWTIQDVATTGTNAGINLQGYTVAITAVPEPAAALLGSLGLLALLRRRR